MTYASFENLRKLPVVENAINLLEGASGGYKFHEMNSARIVPLITNPIFQLSFQDEAYRFFRKHMLQVTAKGDLDCVIEGLGEILEKGYGVSLNRTDCLDKLLEGHYWEDSDKESFFMNSEGELLYTLASLPLSAYLKKSLPEETIKEINQIKSGKKKIKAIANERVRLAVLDSFSFEEFIQGSADKIPIKMALIRYKTLESQFWKDFERKRRIYDPTQRELIGLEGELGRVSRKNLRDFYNHWVVEVISKNQDIFDTATGSKNMPSVYQKNYYNTKKCMFNNCKINELFLDTLSLDRAGVSISVQNNKDALRMKSIIERNLYRVSELIHKREGFCGEKDDALIWALRRRTKAANVAETRVKTQEQELESHFGSDRLSPNNQYKFGIKRRGKALLTKRTVDEGNEFLKESTRRSMKFYNITKDDLGFEF